MKPNAAHCTSASHAIDDVAEGPLVGNGPTITLRDFLLGNYAGLHRRLMRRLGCPDLASECLHETWLRLGQVTLSGAVQCPEAYIYRAACNAATDQLRGDRSSLHLDQAELEHLVDPAPGPHLLAELRSDLRAVEHAMQRLPHRHRYVLVALRVEQKSRQEVADGCHISLASVDTMLRQALDHCAEATGQVVMGGVSRTRRGFSRRWRAASGGTASARQRSGDWRPHPSSAICRVSISS
ncbi:RNA polymerase sigma factor [Variovorax ginsengisoli]|uniref:RNA polymerase sigma-70 factor (ECF subfamily) n=1 Tax=Variovorax ginsengisoli TaxID=363844 RepID=A0ABT9SDL6_9BURK|nr:sigma-70 family RNA polymerase sigma factor [Variovorax ginsengisoli]MDP9902457.1 RNA polymerase sigma-70 factor (ECF subfamily) [Variovorax ginsengisoli]